MPGHTYGRWSEKRFNMVLNVIPVLTNGRKNGKWNQSRRTSVLWVKPTAQRPTAPEPCLSESKEIGEGGPVSETMVCRWSESVSELAMVSRKGKEDR